MNCGNVSVYQIDENGCFSTGICQDLSEAFYKGYSCAKTSNIVIYKREFYPNWMNLGLSNIVTGLITTVLQIVKQDGKNSYDSNGNETAGMYIIKIGKNSEDSIYKKIVSTNIISDKEDMFRNTWHIESIKKILRVLTKNYNLNIIPPPPNIDFFLSFTFDEITQYENQIDELIKKDVLKDCSIFDA